VLTLLSHRSPPLIDRPVPRVVELDYHHSSRTVNWNGFYCRSFKVEFCLTVSLPAIAATIAWSEWCVTREKRIKIRQAPSPGCPFDPGQKQFQENQPEKGIMILLRC
jgi:hypothetical protein